MVLVAPWLPVHSLHGSLWAAPSLKTKKNRQRFKSRLNRTWNWGPWRPGGQMGGDSGSEGARVKNHWLESRFLWLSYCTQDSREGPSGFSAIESSYVIKWAQMFEELLMPGWFSCPPNIICWDPASGEPRFGCPLIYQVETLKPLGSHVNGEVGYHTHSSDLGPLQWNVLIPHTVLGGIAAKM